MHNSPKRANENTIAYLNAPCQRFPGADYDLTPRGAIIGPHPNPCRDPEHPAVKLNACPHKINHLSDDPTDCHGKPRRGRRHFFSAFCSSSSARTPAKI